MGCAFFLGVMGLIGSIIGLITMLCVLLKQ